MTISLVGNAENTQYSVCFCSAELFRQVEMYLGHLLVRVFIRCTILRLFMCSNFKRRDMFLRNKATEWLPRKSLTELLRYHAKTFQIIVIGTLEFLTIPTSNNPISQIKHDIVRVNVIDNPMLRGRPSLQPNGIRYFVGRV